jgi:manganese transport protein
VTFSPWFRPGRTWESGVATASRAVAETIRPLSIRRIGVALEHAEGDAEILSAAISLARAHHGRLMLIHVVDAPGTMMLGKESGSLHGTEDEAYLEELAQEVEDRDLPVETVLRFGQPAEEIIKAADEMGFDLLVLGSHGHRGLEEVVFGQTMAAVRHAVAIPVLVVRTHGRERAQRQE